MGKAGKVVYVLMFAAITVFWGLAGLQEAYEGWVAGQGWTLGIGEKFLGALLPATVAVVATWFLLRRLKQA